MIGGYRLRALGTIYPATSDPGLEVWAAIKGAN